MEDLLSFQITLAWHGNNDDHFLTCVNTTLRQKQSSNSLAMQFQ